MINDDSLLMVLLCTIFLFLSSCAKTIDPDSSGSSDFLFGSDTSLDIVTWNIEHFPKDDRTIGYVSSIIKKMGADVIGLQEISDSDSDTSEDCECSEPVITTIIIFLIIIAILFMVFAALYASKSK